MDKLYAEREGLIAELDKYLDSFGGKAGWEPTLSESLLTRCRAELKATPPREPTSEMMDAARDYLPMMKWPGSLLINGMWRAMFDAAKETP